MGKATHVAQGAPPLRARVPPDSVELLALVAPPVGLVRTYASVSQPVKVPLGHTQARRAAEKRVPVPALRGVALPRGAHAMRKVRAVQAVARKQRRAPPRVIEPAHDARLERVRVYARDLVRRVRHPRRAPKERPRLTWRGGRQARVLLRRRPSRRRRRGGASVGGG